MTNAAAAAAGIIAREAGWSSPEPDAEGTCRFSLDGGLDFSLSSPDGRTIILHADLGPEPDAGTQEGADKLRDLAGFAAGAMASRRSQLSIYEGRLQLHLAFPAQAPAAAMLDNARDFLNDLEWWQAQVRRPSAMSSASPFSFGDGFNMNFLSF